MGTAVPGVPREPSTVPGPVPDVGWIHGSPSAKHNQDPPLQVHVHDERTVVMRQNMAVNYEGPFLFLLFGDERAVLLDTGATREPEWFPLRRTVDTLVEGWLRWNPRDRYQLIVLHTHAHGDHVAGDAQFADRPCTTVVQADRDHAWGFLGLGDDLDETVQLDLGGRVLEIIASPGHHESAVTCFDPHTGWLLTGDTVYPGRLYVADRVAFAATIDRLVRFSERREVSAVVGCHIEMTQQPGVDYPVRTTYQPNEPALGMTVDQLRAVRAAVTKVGGRPGRHVFTDFIIEPVG